MPARTVPSHEPENDPKRYRMETSLSLLIGRYVHSLNGLIGFIRAEVKILRMERSELVKQDSALAGTLAKIEDTAAQVLSLTDEFKLSFASPETGEPVSVKTLLTQALYDSAPPESVTVVLDVGEGLPDVIGTKNLVDVFRNLCTNALEAMPDGGKLEISVKVNQGEDRVEVSFTDTGRGMPSHVVDSLFQPYFSTKRQKGHGLGLWWSKAYLESIGGNIELLWSEVGKGTSFLVSLPLFSK